MIQITTTSASSPTGAIATSHYVARQPILDLTKQTFGYELLFRNGLENFFNESDGDKASLSVINTTFLGGDDHDILSGKQGFINCTRYLVRSGLAELLPRERVVLEILEDIKPDEAFINDCNRLKEKGYRIALDDFEYTPAHDPLVALADFIKVDFLATDYETRKQYAETFLPMGVRLLAEKVETDQDFEEAVELGYTLFQGYFFSRPKVIERKSIPQSKIAALQLLGEVSSARYAVSLAEGILKRDPALSYRLLRYINSAYYGLNSEIRNLRHALNLLGKRNIRHWLTAAILSNISGDKPPEIIQQMLVRGRLCEAMGGVCRLLEEQTDNLFLCGVFSLLPAMIDQPATDVMREISLPDEVKDTILGTQTTMTPYLEVAVGFERADWSTIISSPLLDQIPEQQMPKIYRHALMWASQITG